MGVTSMDARGLGDRGTSNRRTAVPLRPPAEYPPFHVSVLGLSGPAAIPAALAYGLKWHLELMRCSSAAQAKELADNLIAVWEWLKEMEAISPRDRDGALLVRDPMAMFSRARIETELRETATGEAILVAKKWVDAPLPVWQPALFPPELPPDVKADYPARPRSVEETPPFFDAVITKWMLTSIRTEEDEEREPLPAPEPGETGKLVQGFEVLEPPTEIQESEDEAEKAMQAVARKFDSDRWTAERLAAFKGYTPTVNAAIARLRSTTLNDITRHTGVKFESAHADVPLINNTEFILYHSVCSFLIDKDGEPTDLRLTRDGEGLVDYPILIEAPGEQMRRSVPADDGVYISVQKYGDSKFRLNDTGITKLLFGTVGGFTEYGYGYSGPHRIHKLLQGRLDRGGFVAAVTVPGVYAREEITWSRIRNRIPEFVDVVTPYLVKEVLKRASDKLENWEAFVTEVIESVIQELILDKIRDKIRNYLIKKVGKRIVPGLNAVAALVDLFTGGGERTRMRNIIACMIVALRSNAEEDMHIAAKTCSKVVADEFEKAVMDALISHSKKGAAKLARKSKAQLDADEKAERAKPPPKEAPPPPPKAEAPAPAPEPPKTPAAAQRPKAQQVAQPRDVMKQGAPTSVDVPLSNRGAQATTASTKTPDTPAPKGAEAQVKAPRPPNKREREMLKKAEEKQKRHNEKIEELKKAEAKKKEEEQRLAANGGTATGGDGNSDKGTSNKGTEDKGKESTGAEAKPAAKPPRSVKKGPLKPIPPLPPPTIHVKEPDAPPDTHSVQGERKIRTGSHSDEAVGRAEFEKQGGAMGVGEEAHHGMQKRGAGETGEAAREAARTAGTSVNQAANIIPARGLSDDSRAVHGSSAPHHGMHSEYDAETMRRIAETRKDDPEGLASAQADFGDAQYRGARPRRDDFYLGGDPEPKPPRRKPDKTPPEKPEPEK
jgi:hypothetical protein